MAIIRVVPGDCLVEIPRLVVEGVQVDSVVTDPPYHLVAMTKRFGANQAPAKTAVHRRFAKGFMGKGWDGGDVAFRAETWSTIATVLRPGGFMLVFGGTRTHHRVWCAIEDAGFVVQDTILDMVSSDSRIQVFLDSLNDEQRAAFAQAISANSMLAWVFGSGFPKRRDMLKPAFEPICVAYKPGGKRELQIDECRVHCEPFSLTRGVNALGLMNDDGWKPRDPERIESHPAGRWPANVCHDGSDEVMEAFAAFGESTSTGTAGSGASEIYGEFERKTRGHSVGFGDIGSPARFFFSGKAGPDDRFGSRHPTVKPVELMKWLVKLVTPRGGTVLDPFAGSGTTGIAARNVGRNSILIERDDEYVADIRERIKYRVLPKRERPVAVEADPPRNRLF